MSVDLVCRHSSAISADKTFAVQKTWKVNIITHDFNHDSHCLEYLGYITLHTQLKSDFLTNTIWGKLNENGFEDWKTFSIVKC